ncbi:hypothetical protein J6590_043718 [Homalodisca vitripennis]|nr:hypothetical protein J6590_043718 [Homalodisca vitripennis]
MYRGKVLPKPALMAGGTRIFGGGISLRVRQELNPSPRFRLWVDAGRFWREAFNLLTQSASICELDWLQKYLYDKVTRDWSVDNKRMRLIQKCDEFLTRLDSWNLESRSSEEIQKNSATKKLNFESFDTDFFLFRLV